MARVSISEAARLVKVSRPTIYKMINSGKLSYTSVVKHGKGIKVIDTIRSLLECLVLLMVSLTMM